MRCTYTNLPFSLPSSHRPIHLILSPSQTESCPFPFVIPMPPVVLCCLSSKFGLFINEMPCGVVVCVSLSLSVCKFVYSWLKTERIVTRHIDVIIVFGCYRNGDAQFFQFFMLWFWHKLGKEPNIHIPQHRFYLHVNPCHCGVFIA